MVLLLILFKFMIYRKPAYIIKLGFYKEEGKKGWNIKKGRSYLLCLYLAGSLGVCVVAQYLVITTPSHQDTPQTAVQECLKHRRFVYGFGFFLLVIA